MNELDEIVLAKVKLYRLLLSMEASELTNNEIELMALLAGDSGIQRVFDKKMEVKK